MMLLLQIGMRGSTDKGIVNFWGQGQRSRPHDAEKELDSGTWRRHHSRPLGRAGFLTAPAPFYKKCHHRYHPKKWRL